MSRLTVLYDADCGFCRATLSWLLLWDRRHALRPLAIQSAEGQELLRGVPEEERLRSAHAVGEDGVVHSGGAGVAHVARLLPGGAPFAALAGALPGPIDRGYRAVAEHRTALSRLVPARVKERAAAKIAAHG